MLRRLSAALFLVGGGCHGPSRVQSGPPAGVQVKVEFAVLPPGPADERFPPQGVVVATTISGPDGTVAQPWLFVGTLYKGAGDCEPSKSLSFGSVKDLLAQEDGRACDYKAEVSQDPLAGDQAVWLATCVETRQGHEGGLARSLSVRVEAARVPNGWGHDAAFVDSVAAGNHESSCAYLGYVARRDAGSP